MAHSGTARLAVLLLGLAFAAMPANADPRPIVVELFTSQGCSSCPPADALLGELARRSDVLALGFHISYWDSLGWKDPLSSPSSTERQKAYARHFTDGRIYTPQIVVDGTDEMVGSDRAAVLAAIGGGATRGDRAGQLRRRPPLGRDRQRRRQRRGRAGAVRRSTAPPMSAPARTAAASPTISTG